MKLVCGKGINDLKGFSHTRFYVTWMSMIKRCYSAERPTYVGCSVCDEWLTFSKFKAWMETQDWEGKHLDKDILFPGNKVYSPDNCVFVEPELNLFILDNKSTRGEYPLGVSYDVKRKKYRAFCSVKNKSVFLGRFDAPEEAHLAWKIKKQEIASEFIRTTKDVRIIEALRKIYF